MKYIKTFSTLIILLICSCSKNKTTLTEKTTTPSQQSYFITIPITKLSPIESPCIDVEIGEKKVSMELDLGYWGDLRINKELADLISSKTFLREKFMEGIRGKQYPTNLYEIPTVKIGKMTFLNPILQEGTSEFVKDATFTQNGQEPKPRDPGRLGWELFSHVNLLIDIKHSQLAFCDSLETLKTKGYSIESFTKTPLFVNQGVVELTMQTQDKPLRCMIDTACTWNMIHKELPENILLDDAIWDPGNIIEYTSCIINGENFGPISFHPIPIKLPIEIDAILGMEFVKKNTIFLDFRNQSAYISSNRPLF